MTSGIKTAAFSGGNIIFWLCLLEAYDADVTKNINACRMTT
jgi:hypothetical protein